MAKCDTINLGIKIGVLKEKNNRKLFESKLNHSELMKVLIFEFSMSVVEKAKKQN